MSEQVTLNDLGQWTVGQLYPNWEILLAPSSRTMDLTGIANNQISLIIYSSAKVQIGTGAGSFVINNVKPGVVTYTQAPQDVAMSGTYYVRVRMTIFSGSRSWDSDFIKLVLNN